MDQAAVLERLRRVERQAAMRWLGPRAEQDPAGALRAALAELRGRSHMEVEAQLSVPDPHTQRVFMALCMRYGLRVYRKPRQRRSTFMVKGPEEFLEGLFTPLVYAWAEIVGEELAAWVGNLVAELKRDGEGGS